MSQYKKISSMGNQVSNLPSNNPLTYCVNSTLNSRFLHGGQADVLGPDSRSCQLFMSQYCADKWDGFCEKESNEKESYFPDNVGSCNSGVYSLNLNRGQILLRNTAMEKYRTSIRNCTPSFQPFDPTVPSSPMIKTYDRDCTWPCVSEYEVNPASIDSDPVMDKLLEDPRVAEDVLINIYNTMKRKKTLHLLTGTKLGKYFHL